MGAERHAGRNDLLGDLRMPARVLADLEEGRLQAFVRQCLEHGVLPGQGPSSKVKTTSLSRKKSYCLKCSKPKPGPPVVSISTMRVKPMPPGLSHTGMAVAEDAGLGCA